MTETTGPAEPPTEAGEAAEVTSEQPPGQYWLRVHGYPVQIGEELIQYPDFYDPTTGPLKDDPSRLLVPGDVLVYYADGPASVYAVGRVAGAVQPVGEAEGPSWKFPVEPQSVILAMNKAAHAVGLRPPSGWHFLAAARNYTFIRLPAEDGAYLVEQVRARASTKGD